MENYVIIEAQGASVMAYYTQEQGLLSQRRGSSFYFYHYDGLGSTKALTDVNQNAQASYIYDAWGNILQTNGIIANPYLYVGELGYYADGDSGMYLLTQRWYNPVVGRFVVRDPRRVRNLYNYTGANPLNNIDPTGLTIMPIDLREVCIPIWRHEEEVRRMEIGQARFCWRVTNSTGIGIPIAGPGVGGAVIPLVGYCSYRCDSPCLHEDVPIPFKVTITYLCISKCRGVYTKKETQTVYKVAHAAPVAWHCYQFGQEKKVTLPGYLVWDDMTNQWKCDLPP